MKNIGLETIIEFHKTLTKGPGVYRMLDVDKKILYIGKAKNLSNRVKNYTAPARLTTRIQRMVSQTRFMEITNTNSEAEALLLEASLIKSLKPKYNILLRDDKTFPYIWIRSQHSFPQISKYRGSKKPEGKIFGPFASARDVNEAISFLQKIFMLRPCSDEYFANRSKPCLQYQIKRCSGPCAKKIDEVSYQESVRNAEKFLAGKSHELQKNLVEDMEKASHEMEYEKAANIRDRIKILTHIQMKNSFTDLAIGDVDVLAVEKENDVACVEAFFYRGGQSFGNKAFFPIISRDSDLEEIMSAFIGQIYQSNPPPKDILVNIMVNDKLVIEEALKKLYGHKVTISQPKLGGKKRLIDIALKNAKSALENRLVNSSKQRELLDQVAELFGIEDRIKRIEVYDNSHISGKFAVGAMIVAGEEGFDKKSYRKYTINTNTSPTGGDDYQMLREVLTRRLSRLKREKTAKDEDNWPDLLLIDGGLGHLNIAKEVIEKLQMEVNYVSIAKGPERNAGKEVFHTHKGEVFTLDKNWDIMKFLQRLRDEAHRFAITSHRDKRSRNLRHSSLDNISGISNVRKKLLLNHFGSVDNIKNASVEEIAKIKNFNKITAKKIYDYFHQD